MSALSFDYVVPGDDFTQAGAASSDVKRKLKKIGYDADVIRRVAIAMYEGEINLSKAMQEGWSTAPDNVRSLGFGAGMGLPNIKKYSDILDIDTKVGEGTTLYMTVFTDRNRAGGD